MNGLLWNAFFLVLLLKSPKENKWYLFFCGWYDSMYDAFHWQAHRLAQCKTLSNDCGQSIYLALSHFICKNTAWQTVVQSMTSTKLIKVLTKDFFLVSFRLNYYPWTIALNANCHTIFIRSDWEKYCHRIWQVQHLTSESATGTLFWITHVLDYFKRSMPRCWE